MTADPRDADYHFNLAMSLARIAAIQPERCRKLNETLKLRPRDRTRRVLPRN